MKKAIIKQLQARFKKFPEPKFKHLAWVVLFIALGLTVNEHRQLLIAAKKRAQQSRSPQLEKGQIFSTDSVLSGSPAARK